MLSDRPYMRDDYQRERTSFLIWMLSAIVAGFVVQNIFAVTLGRPEFINFTALSAAAIKQGYLWTLLTYPLLHEGVLSLLLLGLGIFFIGRELIQHLGERRMAWLTVGSVMFAGLAWFAVNFNRGGVVMNSTAILLCYLTVFACLFPNREISFLIFFVLPVTTRPKYVAWIVLFVSLVGFAFSELRGERFQTGVPHSAHLGAMLAGWLYFRYCHDASWLALRRPGEIDLPRWLKRARKPAGSPVSAPAAAASASPDIRAEVDRILDKINSHGFGALTPEEKRKLDDAKDLLSRR